MHRTRFQFLPPLLIGLLLAVLLMSHNATSQTSAYVDEIPQPLPPECDGVGPLDDPDACCAFGYVYFNNQPVNGANVHIESASDTVTLTTGDYGFSSEPHYRVDLTTDLDVSPGDLITITVSYNDMVSMRTWTVQPDSQQIDIGLLEGYQADEPLSANNALDELAPPHVQTSGYSAVLVGNRPEPQTELTTRDGTSIEQNVALVGTSSNDSNGSSSSSVHTYNSPPIDAEVSPSRFLVMLAEGEESTSTRRRKSAVGLGN